MRALTICTVLLLATVAFADEEKALKLYQRGHAKLNAGKPEEAITLFEKALAEDPKSFLAEHGLGNACAALGKFEEAVRHFRAAVRLKPDFAQAHNSLGVVLAALKRPVEAAAAYERAIAVKPDYIAARTNLAETQISAGELDLADRTLADALEIDPKAEVALYLSALIAMKMKEPDIAVTLLERAIAAKPDFAAAQLALGEILYRKGKLEPADEALRQAVKHDEKNARSWFLLGLVSSRQRDWKSAARAFGRARELRPKNADAAMNHGIALLGQFEETSERSHLVDAVAALSRARTLDPAMKTVAGLLKKAKDKLAELPEDSED